MLLLSSSISYNVGGVPSGVTASRSAVQMSALFRFLSWHGRLVSDAGFQFSGGWEAIQGSEKETKMDQNRRQNCSLTAPAAK